MPTSTLNVMRAGPVMAEPPTEPAAPAAPAEPHRSPGLLPEASTVADDEIVIQLD